MDILNSINDFLWTYIVITMLVASALYFTIRTRGLQFRLIGDMLKVLFNIGIVKMKHRTDKPVSSFTKEGKKNIGSFQAFAVSLSSRVGTGNLAGVASAIFVGGPGAVFWMWVMALLGSATAFVEATLAQLYKRKSSVAYYGGPAYYMETGLGKRWMGILFAIMITVTFGMANQLVQSTTLCDALADAFTWNKAIVGGVIAIATLVIVFGGVTRVSRFSSIVVPFMALGFILLSIVIVAMNITKLPYVFSIIIEGAFGVHQMAGGAIGVAVMQGVKRGLFSNEAGEGSAPNAAAIAETSHPVKQGLLQAFGVFTDTLIICSCTAFIILLSGKYDCGKDGILLTAEALDAEVGSIGRYFITAAISLFAYSTIIANSFYGETNIRFITKSKMPVFAFRIFTGLMVMAGALMDLQTAFSFVDIVMGLMTILNLIAILLLFPQARKLLLHYEKEKREGREPTFRREDMPEIKDSVECWE